jgi:hypothetical protein
MLAVVSGILKGFEGLGAGAWDDDRVAALGTLRLAARGGIGGFELDSTGSTGNRNGHVEPPSGS